MSRIGEDEKQAAREDVARWEDAEDAAGLTASALVFGGAAGTHVSLPLATAGVILALSKIKKHASSRIANDPPDERFREPVAMPEPTFDSRAFGSSDGTPLGRACENLAAGAAATEGFVTAVERAMAADIYGAQNYASDRRRDATALAERASQLLIQSQARIEPLVVALSRSEAARPISKAQQALLGAALSHHDSPAVFLSQGAPDAWLAMLFRGAVRREQLVFSVDRTLGNGALQVMLARGTLNVGLADAIAKAAEASVVLGAAIRSSGTPRQANPGP